MWTPTLYSILAPIFLAGGAWAQLATVTLPFVDGDTLVVSTGTNALGLPTTFATLRTVTGTGTALTTPLIPTTTALTPTRTGLTTALTTPLTTALTTPLTTGRVTTTARATTPTTAGGRPLTTDGNRIGQDTALPPPMRTTTYWFDTGNGYWTVATWTASVTRAPTVATVIPPQGTVQEYQQYQTSVNSNVFASAQAAAASRGAGEARAAPPMAAWGQGGLLGWGIMGVGAVIGAGLAF